MQFEFNFEKRVGKIRPMHAVGQPPILGISTSYFHYLTESGIPYSRLHDVGGDFGDTIKVAARAAAMMLAMQQHSKTDILCYYDAHIGCSAYGGMFNPVTLEPWPLYYSFAAFGELYRLGEQVECIYPRTKDVFALGVTDGKKHAALYDCIRD